MVGGAYGLVFVALRRWLYRVGGLRFRANAAQFKAANEAFGAIKEVKASGQERAFLDRYDPEARRFAHAQAIEQMLSQLPRYLIEVVGIGSVLLLILILVGSGQDASVIVPLVGVYAVAGYRLLPAFQSIYAGATQIRAHTVAISALHASLQSTASDDRERSQGLSRPESLSFGRSIELCNITFTYPGRRIPALQKVTLTIPHGASVAFVGETGAGKTTLADIILGLLQPNDGRLLVDGVALDERNLARWRANVGYVPQHIFLSDDTVAANIAFGALEAHIDRNAIERAARIANLHEFIVNSLPNGYETLVGERGIRLSGGQRQRIGIARALYHDPDVLVLDEATSALDGATESEVMEAITALASTKTIIVIAHRLTSVRDCDQIYLFEHGRISAHGSYGELVQSNVKFRQMSNLHS